jgi:hypothetical protein
VTVDLDMIFFFFRFIIFYLSPKTNKKKKKKKFRMFLWFLRRTTHFLWTTEWERVMEGFENIWAGAPSMFTVCECGGRFDDCFIPVEDTPFSSYVLHPLSLYILYIYIYILLQQKNLIVCQFLCFCQHFGGLFFGLVEGRAKKQKPSDG